MNIEMPAHVFAIEKRVRVPPTPPLFLLYLVTVTKMDGDSFHSPCGSGIFDLCCACRFYAPSAKALSLLKKSEIIKTFNPHIDVSLDGQ